MDNRRLQPNYVGLLLSDVYFLLTGDYFAQLPKDLRNELRLWYFHCRKVGLVPFAYDEMIETKLFEDVPASDLYKK